MKKTILNLLVILSLPIYANNNPNMSGGQAYHPLLETGKTWEIELGYTCAEFDAISCFCSNGIQTVTIAEPIERNDKYYYQLISSETELSSGKDVVALLREDGEQVYFYSETCKQEFLLYDFSLSIGDKVSLVDNMFLVCDEIDFHSHTFTVTGAKTINQNGVSRKKLQLTNGTWEEIWIEGIGSLRGVHYTGVERTGISKLIRCNMNENTIFKNECDEPCINEPSSFAIIHSEQNISMWIENKIISLRNVNPEYFYLYHLDGSFLQRFPVCSKVCNVDASHLPKGLYILTNKVDYHKIIAL